MPARDGLTRSVLRRAIRRLRTTDGSHFISVAEWESPDHRDRWRADPDFAAHRGMRCVVRGRSR
jgi:heme-degrading monooxygenase HmoA